MSPLAGTHNMPFKPGMRQSHAWLLKIVLLVYECIHTHTHTHTYTHTYAYTRTHTHRHTHAHTNTHTHTRMHIHICKHTCSYAYTSQKGETCCLQMHKYKAKS